MISVMFCEIEGLNPQTSKQDVMCLVECMNIIFSHFDNLTDRHDVYKVSITFYVFKNLDIEFHTILNIYIYMYICMYVCIVCMYALWYIVYCLFN